MSTGPSGAGGAAGGGGALVAVGSDPQALLDGLVDGVGRALPDGGAALEVERDRSLGDRLAGRTGRVSSLRLSGPELVLALRLEGGGRRLAGEASRTVRGVVISRRALPLGEWLTAFAEQVAALAAEVSGDAATASRALSALGVAPAGSDLAVGASDVTGGLRALAARAPGRVPPEAADAVRRVVDLLLDTLPRVGAASEGDQLVRRTATVYLPETLQAYAALPADWARTHVLPDGTTAAQALLAQLQALEQAAQGMRDAAVSADASALLANGRFLTDRFGASSLDLPG